MVTVRDGRRPRRVTSAADRDLLFTAFVLGGLAHDVLIGWAVLAGSLT